MLQAINDRIKGWLGALVIVLITIPFAFWGVESYLGSGGQQFAAIVDGEEIPMFQFDDAYSNQLARLNQQFGSNLPLSNEQIKTLVLDQLVNAVVLEKGSYASGYRISDSNLKRSLERIFTRDGSFDRDFFENVVAANDLTISQYETRLRNELRVVQKQNAITSSAILTASEAKRLAAIDQQEREIRWMLFDVDAQSDDVAITEQEIEDFYNANTMRFMTPEKVMVEYVEVTADDISDSVTVDEGQLEEMYADYERAVRKREERKARHILLQTGSTEDKSEAAVMERMQELKQRLDGGASFETLAQEFSEDPGSAQQGGDLGWVAHGDMVKPFEETLFGMQKGEISDVVETQFGLHLIRLDDIRVPELASFAEKRGEFEQQIKQEVITNMFYDISENMAVSAYENPESLEAVVEVVNKQPERTEWFTVDAGTGIAENAKFRNTAFSAGVLEEGLNSDIIEISPNHVAVLRLLDHEQASKKPLQEVRVQIEEALRERAARSIAMTAAEQAKSQILAGTPAEDVLADGQRIEGQITIKRTDTNKADPMIIDAAFQMPHPQKDRPSVQVVNTLSGDVAVVLLDKVDVPDELDDAQIATVKSQRQSEVADSEFDFVIDTIKGAAEIERNNDLLQ